jgi:hypothetical protein
MVSLPWWPLSWLFLRLSMRNWRRWLVIRQPHDAKLSQAPAHSPGRPPRSNHELAGGQQPPNGPHCSLPLSPRSTRITMRPERQRKCALPTGSLFHPSAMADICQIRRLELCDVAHRCSHSDQGKGRGYDHNSHDDIAARICLNNSVL